MIISSFPPWTKVNSHSQNRFPLFDFSPPKKEDKAKEALNVYHAPAYISCTPSSVDERNRRKKEKKTRKSS
jgi:hypothetical protein